MVLGTVVQVDTALQPVHKTRIDIRYLTVWRRGGIIGGRGSRESVVGRYTWAVSFLSNGP